MSIIEVSDDSSTCGPATGPSLPDATLSWAAVR